MRISQPTDGHPHQIAHQFDMLRRRHQAAQRMEPTTDGQRDPLYTRAVTPSEDPRTILEFIARGMPVTREQCNIAWHSYPEHRPQIEAAAAALREWWAAA